MDFGIKWAMRFPLNSEKKCSVSDDIELLLFVLVIL